MGDRAERQHKEDGDERGHRHRDAHVKDVSRAERKHRERSRSRDRKHRRSSRSRSRSRDRKHRHRRSRSSSSNSSDSDDRRKHSKHSRRHRSRSRSRSRDKHSKRSYDKRERDDAPRQDMKEDGDRAPTRVGSSNKTNKLAEVLGYTAENNPFGDSNLNETFVWGKKIQREIATGKRDKVPTKADLRAERDGLIDDIEKARARREAREAEREEMERVRTEEARLRDIAQFSDWQKKEESFMLRQIRERTLIRIRQGRERVIDKLAKNPLLLRLAETGEERAEENAVMTFDCQLDDPTTLMHGLSSLELEELRKEIEAYRDLAADGETSEAYWSQLLVLCDDAIRRAHATERGIAAGRTLASINVVQEEMDALFAGKTAEELARMEGEVRAKLARHGDRRGVVVDVEYWERVLEGLKVAQAAAACSAMHDAFLLQRLQQMDKRRREMYNANVGATGTSEWEPVVAPAELSVPEASTASASAVKADAGGDVKQRIADILKSLRTEGVLPPEGYKPPVPLLEEQPVLDDVPEDMDFVDAEGNVLPTGIDFSDMRPDNEYALPTAYSAALAASDAAATKTAGIDDAQVNALKEKYRPRKPRYINKVKVGYDWNKYNKTHYDNDNPPPKSVQGYKFNIFYPDLLNPSKAPSFFLEPADSDAYCIIRFHAGPPYEDIAFKIVNREWEYLPKFGFKCVFDRGVLQLHFNFKRYRYRR